MVMHARKPQRISDGYFEKHQPHYQSSKYNNSKREYDRETSSRSTNYRDRESSPSAGGIGSSLNNGNTTYRSQSPEVDSPSRHDIRDRDRDRERFSYIQKMRDRDRDVYKKDKYSDKRERRNERESEHRTNHDRLDRRTKLSCANSGDKRSGSDDRERDRERDLRDGKRDRNERDRDRDRDRERDRDRDRNERDRDRDRNERGERVARCGDWSEHVSSSGKMYYYNCKTEVSQWEKPKEWIEKERNLARDQHREKEYREKDRERDREDRFNRTSTYSKHSNSRGNSRLRWPYENDSGPPPLRRRLDDNPDMDISPGDSTPTSEASYSLSGTPNANQLNEQSVAISSGGVVGAQIPVGPVLLANALPRLASHPQSNTALLSQVHYPNVGSATPGTVVNLQNNCHRNLDTVVQQSTLLPVSSPNHIASLQSSSTGGNHLLHHHIHLQLQQSSLHPSVVAASGISDHHINSNAPGPPKVGTKGLEPIDSQKHGLITRQQLPLGTLPIGTLDATGNNTETNHNSSLSVTDLRESALNSPLYNFSFSSHGLSPLNQTRNPLGSSTIGNTIGTPTSAFASNITYGLKTADGVTTGSSVCPISSLSNISAIASTSGNVLGNTSTALSVTGAEGPPTPTQELDATGLTIDQRRLEGASSSASISNLQSCVVSTTAVRSQDPELSPKLAKYFRGDLIAHYNNWPGYIIEKQIQKIPEEKHIYGDLQNSKISAELKCARSVLRITEIKSTIQMQKILYLREQVQQLEELKTQNSFMSNDL